jgi:hypothetical protein
MFDQPSGQFNRRHFLIGGAALAGSLVVGWALLPPRQRLDTSAPNAPRGCEAQRLGHGGYGQSRDRRAGQE